MAPDPTAAEPAREGAGAISLPVDLRSAAPVVVAIIASLALLHWASSVFVPLVLSMLVSYALMPVVDRMERWRVPRALSAGLVLIALGGALGFTAVALQDDAQAMVESLPEAARKLQRALGVMQREPNGTLSKVQEAARTIEEAVTPAPERDVPRVQIEMPRAHAVLWTGTLGLVTLAGQAVIVTFLTFFVLAGGNTLRRKLMDIAGPSFARRRITLELLGEIELQIQRYLMVNIVNSVVIGLAIWLLLWWVGLEYAVVWGLIAALLNWVPYLGATAITIVTTLAAYVQFGSFDKAAVVLAGSTLAQILQGNLLLPWMLSRASRMSPVVVFVALLLFGWLWGVPGLLLGVPAMMVVKTVCDRVDDFKPLGRLLGS